MPVRCFEDDKNPRIAPEGIGLDLTRHEHTSASRGLRRREGRRGIMACLSCKRKKCGREKLNFPGARATSAQARSEVVPPPKT